MAGIFRRVKHFIRRSHKLQQSHGYVAMHSWADDRSFLKNQKFENIFFMGIADRFMEKKIPFFYLIDVLPTYFYPQALLKLIRNDEEFILLEELISPSDVWKSLNYMRSTPLTKRPLPSWERIDMTDIVFEEFRRDNLNIRREESYLRYCSTRSLKQNYRTDIFLYLFENQIWEKLFCAGIREFEKETKLVGYAHTLVRSMYTCYSMSRHERNIMPLPDIIIASGELGKTTLEQSGFTDETILVGGALRYPHINQRISGVQPKKPLNKKKVLIALSGGLDESLELISKVVKSLNGLDVDIIVKCHPVLPYIQISRYIGEFSEKLIVSDKSIDSLLADTDLVFYTETTVSVEALAQGIPIIHVKSDCRIDMNIFEDLPSVPSESDSTSLQKAAMNALTVSRPIISEENQRFIKCLFLPVRDDIVEMFTT